MQPDRSFTLLPFPGGPFEGIVSGLIPPTDDAGELLSIRTVGPNAELLSRAAGGGWKVCSVRQVHGTRVVCAPFPDGETPEADALVTDQPGVLLVTRHADCMPLLIWDPRCRALGLAHSGRRGTLANVAASLLGAMRDWYGTRPSEVVASVGPGIRECCYEVGEDAFETPAERAVAAPYLRHRDGSLYLDLFHLLEAQLRKAGARVVHGIEEAECTCCGPTGFHSYRRDRAPLRFAALAGIRDG